MNNVLRCFKLASGVIAAMWFLGANASELEVGDVAPSFELSDQTATVRRLADYRGRWLVLYFYPKDDTPGCTTEACQFRDDILMFRELGVQVLGVSLDDATSHAKFAEKYGLPFPLLADTDGAVAKAYGALTSFGPVRYAKRHTYVIDPQGKVAKVYRKVKPKEHSDQLIADLQALQANE